MQPIDTNTYQLERVDGAIMRLEGVLNGVKQYAPEDTEEYYDSQIAFHEQVVENLKAQKQKLVEFKKENPEPDVMPEAEGEPMDI